MKLNDLINKLLSFTDGKSKLDAVIVISANTCPATPSVEIKSVNSRFLDLSVNIPPFLNQLENRIRTLVAEKVSRGKVDVTIRIHDTNSAATVTADTKAAVEYRDAIASVAQALGKKVEDIPLSLIIAQQGVLNVSYDYDVEAYWKKMKF